jgi:soluble lytic murein transglycosylase-like protein
MESYYRNPLKGLLIILAVAAISILILVPYRSARSQAQKEIENITASHAELLSKYNATKDKERELADCLSRMSDPAERNVEDLERYIQARYPGVAKELASIIAFELDDACTREGVPFPLAVGLMEIESRFNPFAKSSVGARGLLQVMPDVWGKTLGIKDARELHGVHRGIECGISVLKHYIDKNQGNITKALQNYNGTTGSDFHTSVYEMVGRFTVFRWSQENKEDQQEEVSNDT